jgi:hypothetical protein
MASRLPAETRKKPSPVSNHMYSSTGAKFTRVTNPPPLSAKTARCVGYGSVAGGGEGSRVEKGSGGERCRVSVV